MRKTIVTLAAAALVFGVISTGCSTAPKTADERAVLKSDADTALQDMYKTDAGLQDFLKKAHGYAVFPAVGKGGLIVGGAYGKGIVYESGVQIGYADLSQANIGLQAGGQSYREIVAFETKEALENFKTGKLKFSADASAVALKSGASASAKYTDGVAIFTKPEGGLMFEASVGGQQFTFKPDADVH